MPELDALRGIAVLMVLFFHGFYMATGAERFHGPIHWFLLATAGGWMGVNLFFVLSGFLITGILLDSRDKPDYYRNFYLRRALRILPAYYGVLLVVLIAARTGIVERNVSWAFVGLSFIYLTNVTGFFGVQSQYTVLWSLAVEEHFYLLWPTVVRNFTRRALPWICGFIIVGCPALRAFYFWRHYEYGSGYTWLVADGLAWGALLATLARGKLSSRSSMLGFGISCLAGTLATVVLLVPFGIAHTGAFAGGVVRVSLINSFFAAVLTLVVVAGSGSWRAIFEHSGLKFFGDISYGLYLIHMLAFDFVNHVLAKFGLQVSRTSGSLTLIFARFAAGAALSIAIAYVSRWYFEERFLTLRSKFAPGRTATPPIKDSQVKDSQAAIFETEAAS
jgi:peptidoglycan/LPS O-acetylase OafA/YrhL